MKWKSIGLGIGGLFLSGAALASTVFFARKKSEPLAPPYWIPEQPDPFSIITADIEWHEDKEQFRSHLEYLCQPTQFRLWNLVDLDLYRMQREGGPKIEGHPIFHITSKIHLQGRDGMVTSIEDEKFYATIHTHRGKSVTTLASCIQLGRFVEFRKCHVGGGLNGIETGERAVSMAPVKEIRFASK
jgi:hypothetical protein